MTNKELVEKFYKAFSQRDHQGMNACYADDIVFSDPVFGFLQGAEVRAMWQMLCTNARDFELTYGPVEEVDQEYITCKWTATYTFSTTGRKVVNHAKSFMKIADGRISEHSDGFRLSTWIGQAFGWRGKLFGWTNFMKQKIHKTALKNLRRFMELHQTPSS